MIKYLSTILLFIFSFVIHAQSPEEFPGIGKNNLRGIKITRTRSFNGESLYGYINGGADLYLEYGFRRVEVTDLIFEERKYKIEVWQMNDPEASFGIFSVSRHKCLSKPSFTTHSCLNRYQLQFSRGEYYISIINEAGTPADTSASLIMAKLIEGRIAGNPFSADSFNNGPKPVGEDFLLVRGRLGLMNGIPDMEDYFKDITGYTALFSSGDDKTIISVRFDNNEQMQAFCKLNRIILPESGAIPSESVGQKVTRINENQLYIEKQ